MSWISKPFEASRAEFLEREFGYTTATSVLLSRLPFHDLKAVRRFLNPKLTHLRNPFLIPNIEEAVIRLIEAVDQRQRVFVIGDYDVDGVTSTALFVGVLRELGLDPGFSVPRRVEDGVGLSLPLVNEKVISRDEPFDLLVALDCGTNDREAIARDRKSTRLNSSHYS